MTDAKKVRQQARKIIGQSGLDQLAEHDAALVHHASEIEALRARQDDMLTKAAAHARGVDAALIAAGDFAAVRTDALWRPLLGRLRWLLTGK